VALWTLCDPIAPPDVDEGDDMTQDEKRAEQLIRRVEAILRSDET
jgi:hypothetical protein